MIKHIFKILLLFSMCNIVNADPMPHVTAQAWLIADENGKMLDGTNTSTVRSIASITKVMTAMVVLDSGQSLSETIPKKLYNKNLTRETLIELAMIKSDNTAAKLLCEYYPGGMKQCIQAMNNKAKQLQMNNSEFTDPTGLLASNISTAEDLVKLVLAASKYPVIVNASGKNTVRVETSKKKSLVFHNTNSLVNRGYHFIVSKTGWITKSGGCIVMMLDTIHGVRTVILLGSKNTKTRIPEAHLISTLY
jgi:D-alanyl-D-alanine endopeptidase (penicillin-binding protein 7)